jgi:TetR/AcrR family tetracycline transcriptional repressor
MAQLRRADVLRGARAVLAAEGLDGLTMRKLGALLNVQAGGLYWHFANKQALLEALGEEVVAGVGAGLPDGPWDEQLVTLAGRARAALLSVRDGARLVSETFVTEPHTMLLGRVGIDLLVRAGLPVEQAAWTMFAVFHYVVGQAIEEQARAQQPPGSWEAKLEPVDGELGPSVAQALRSALTADQDERFAYGLELFVDGIRRRVA